MLPEDEPDRKAIWRHDQRTPAETRQKRKVCPSPGSRLRSASGHRCFDGVPDQYGRESDVVPPRSNLGLAPDTDCSSRSAPALPAESPSTCREDPRETAYTYAHVDRGPATEHP